jgi:large subunit ribosomal protein L22
MEVRAQLKNVPMGARKGRLVAELVRRKPCDEALSLLRVCPKSAARPIAKLIQSALANAQIMNERKSAGLDLDNLIVKKICVDQATHSWRVRPRAMGRSYWVRKASSHVTVVLAEA